MSTTMNSASITEYILKLEKENAESRTKIEQLKKLYKQSEDERVATLEKLNSKLLDDEIRRVGAVLNESDTESVASNDPETESDDEDYFVSYNEELAEALDSLAYFEKDFHKAAAYDDAAYAVQHLPFKVTNGDELAKGPRKVKGIGKSIAAKINEFLDTGKIEKLEKLKRSKAVDESHDDYFIESNPVSTNEEIAWHLDKLASSNDNPHKVRAYRKAAEAIRGLDFEVTNGTEISQGPRKIPGIGKSIAAKIDKLIVTGKMN
jgi:hypothetical protein